MNEVFKLKTFFIIGAVLAAFLWASSFSPPAPPRAETEEKVIVAPENYERSEKLQKTADDLLPLFDNMPPVPVFVTDEPVIKTGTNTERGVAYTACDTKGNPVIFVKKIYFENANAKQLLNILKHEQTHAYFCRQGRMWGHDEQFRRKFKEVGGIGN